MSSEKFNFQSLKTTDFDFYREMFFQSLHVPPGRPPFSRSILEEPGLQKYLVDWGRVGDIGIVVRNDSEAIGAVWCRLLDGYGFVDEETPELGIALMKAWRGRGLGTQLIERLMARCREADFGQLSLSVSKTNPARHLYQQLGFEKVREDQESWIMLKNLNK